jgi:uncharacterized protein (TIGR02594 family)
MPTPIPPAYSWLPEVPGLPRLLVEGLTLYGVRELKGPGDNPEILAWAREVGIPETTYRHDETAWCGLWMAVVAKRAGKTLLSPPGAALWALSWRRWEQPSPRPSLGDVLVFTRPEGGHVGLYVGEDVDCWHVLGGNTADSVSIARLRRERLVACRRPAYRVPPAGVRPVFLAPSGAVSENEA